MLVTLCLNPCSNGMKIEYGNWDIMAQTDKCLNPCSNGMKIEWLLRSHKLGNKPS